MSSLVALVILVTSLWLCSVIDGLPHLLANLFTVPQWLWLGLGLTLLSWVMKDS